jgi:hypothetical protein
VSGPVVHTRARPESVRLTETYLYEREVSRNPFIRSSGTPTGRIEIVVPCDGHKHFTRQACGDVEHRLPAGEARPHAEALLGHLALADHGETDLRSVLDLDTHHGSVPLRVPVRADGSGDFEHLRDERHAWVIKFDYSPNLPNVIPIQIEMQLLDEDSLSPLEDSLSAEDNTERLGDSAAQIAQQVNFRRNLLLATRVLVHLPNASAPDGAAVRIRRMSLGWPTITSFRALKLDVDGEETRVTYNPSSRCLEWTDIPMTAVDDPADSNLRTYVTAAMLLRIGHPGELYQQATSDGRVEVEIRGRLLSGTMVRLFSALGTSGEPKPELTTRVIADLRLILDDAFARRTRSCYQHLHFDEVIPEPMRISDIRTTLADRGFRLARDLQLRSGRNELRHLIEAQRPDGPDVMSLRLFIIGKRYQTERQRQVPGGQKFTSQLESGELKLYMGGELPGDSRSLTQEMNALQEALRDRFERVRAKH